MNKKIDKDSYQKLITDISSVYERARYSFVMMYWHIGKYIVEVEMDNRQKGEYGDFLTTRLSGDLTEKYGKGFSKTNIKNMCLFYRTYSIGQISDRLEWSKYVTLLTIKDDKERRLLEERVINERLKYTELRDIVLQEYSGKKRSGNGGKRELDTQRGLLYTYPLIKTSRINVPRGTLILDLGFNNWKNIPDDKGEDYTRTEYILSKKNNSSFTFKPADDTQSEKLYTYRAYIEKIIDGDTLWVIVDCGFHSYTRQKLRLRGIDTPEMESEEGRRAKRFVERMLTGLPFIIVKTYKSDKYDRYLTDLFFLRGEDDPEKVCAEGRFLNRELVEKGLAVPV
jgi:endonuclease YncB( thermonuclease family)